MAFLLGERTLARQSRADMRVCGRQILEGSHNIAGHSRAVLESDWCGRDVLAMEPRGSKAISLMLADFTIQC